MLYRELIAVCSEIHTKYALYGQNVELLNVKLALQQGSSGPLKIN